MFPFLKEIQASIKDHLLLRCTGWRSVQNVVLVCVDE